MTPETILLSLVQGPEGEQWASSKDGWTRSIEIDVCKWTGIVCDPTTHEITGIFLSESSLVGSIPPELGELRSVRSLSLNKNFLFGRIPQSVADLPLLEYLNLGENQITGTVPKLASTALRSVNFGYNRLRGSLSDEIGRMHPEMTDFDVMMNKLTGTIPDSFSEMKKLSGLSLSGNQFSGTIPEDIGTIPTLEYLYLDNNYLMGTIPPEFGWEGSSLQELWLQNNLLSGTVPAKLSVLTDLINLYIDENKFTGTVPLDLCRAELNADFYKQVKTDVERDYCESIACPTGHVSVEGIYPCIPCKEAYYNPYLGKRHECFDLNQRDILAIFFNSTGGKDWIEDENWEVADSFLCTFSGITCDVNNHVTAIELKNKGLTGTIPPEIGFLRYLQRLDLSDNDLDGFLPSDLRWAPLNLLDVSGNRLRGIVPPMLCLKEGINGNGDQGDYNCENIACPVGYYSPTGNADCKPCIGDNAQGYLGSKQCSANTSTSLMSSFNHVITADSRLAIAVLGIATFATIIFFFFKKRKNEQEWDTGDSLNAGKRNTPSNQMPPKFLTLSDLHDGTFPDHSICSAGSPDESSSISTSGTHPSLATPTLGSIPSASPSLGSTPLAPRSSQEYSRPERKGHKKRRPKKEFRRHSAPHTTGEDLDFSGRSRNYCSDDSNHATWLDVPKLT